MPKPRQAIDFSARARGRPQRDERSIKRQTHQRFVPQILRDPNARAGPACLLRQRQLDIFRTNAKRQFAARAGGTFDGQTRTAKEAGFNVTRQQIHRRTADESGDKQIRGPMVDFVRRRVLLEKTFLEDRDAAGQRHRLHLIVRDVQRDDTQLMLQVLQLGAHVDAQTGVEIRQRLVHQKRLRAADDGPGQRDALPLASRKLLRLFAQQLGEAKARGDFFDLRRNF